LQENPAFSPQLGFLYFPRWPEFTTFFSHSQSFRERKEDKSRNGSFLHQLRGGVQPQGLASRRMAGSPAEAMFASAPMSAPMAASSMADGVMAKSLASAETANALDTAGNENGANLPPPTLRSDFRDVAQWLATLRTGREGTVTGEVPLPESLTRWTLVAVGADGGNRVGNQTTSTVVTKDLIARLEPPRFLVERDELSVAAIVQSNLTTTENVLLILGARGPVAPVSTDRSPSSQNDNQPRTLHRATLKVGPATPVRVDVPLTALRPGETTLTLSAQVLDGPQAGTGDALERTFPIREYGAMQFLAWAGSMDQGTTTARGWVVNQEVTLPAGAQRGTTRLRVEVQSTLLRALFDSLPYLVEYPYGCVEQTVSRFAPAAAVLGVAQKLNLPPDPDFDRKLNEVMRIGVERLGTMQRPDGGWGWWSGDAPNPYMTAFVAYSLTMARQSEATIPQNMLQRALDNIAADLARPRSPRDEERTWYYGWNNSLHTEALQALQRLWTLRGDLRPQGLAMLARVLRANQRKADAEVALRNLANFAVVNEELGTMHWGDRDRGWYWWDDAVESTAMGLHAYLDVSPDSIEARRAMAWLVMNRRGSRWKSTKDSAAAIFALTRWVLERKEGANTATFRIEVLDRTNNKTIASRLFQIQPEDLWTGQFHLDLIADQVAESGQLLFRVNQESGTAPGYFGITAEFLNRSEKIAEAGRELKVSRSYQRVVKVAPRDQKTQEAQAQAEAPRRKRRGQTPVAVPAKVDETRVAEEKLEPLRDGDILQPGDMVEVTLNLTTSNDFEYLVIEDPKPATFEPTDVQSGSTYADGLCSNVELRDQYVAFFITLLREGKHTLKYRVRAESVGVFRALPSQGSSMYVPELRANSSSGRVEVREHQPARITNP
jgi:uncharacterized protein YfaS (alpha-2-macroglobulin family)